MSDIIKQVSTMKKVIVVIMVFFTFIILGCADRQGAGDVSKEWHDNSRQLGFYPIYPPSGEFFPGDIYITPFSPAQGKIKIPAEFYTIQPIRYTSIDVSDALTEAPDFQRTAEWTDASDVKHRPEPFLNYPASGRRVNNIVAFPGFRFASVGSASFGAGFPADGWAAKIGLAKKTAYTVTYNVPNAESLSIDFSTGADKMIEWRQKVNTQNLQFIDDKMKAAILSIQNRYKINAKVEPGIVFITTVYYARSLDVTISSSEGFSASASATISELVNLSKKKSALMNELNKIKPDGSANGDEVAANVDTEKKSNAVQQNVQSIQSQIDSINTSMSQLSQAMAPGAPGATGTVTRVTASGITLQQVFPYPVAIGYSGITVTIPEFLYTCNVFNKTSAKVKIDGCDAPAIPNGYTPNQVEKGALK